MLWNDERLMKKDGFFQSFPAQISKLREAQFWQESATNFNIYQNVFIIPCAFLDRLQS